ncbi:hypothetical protein CkaCkLH20_00927 [Colletotrichum karsti]|uniref:Clr5 domain-containing protein n=1 Tax=Colletotrichum karsti TaxID=1095194 RepID=A0A9P6IIF6_9PEZI|nr:uncharacterized protein CkaCkLH20_00927 [Colletotrichum karsti]KAF9881781.1 hypothetical protein CkaCkLH20_00927 [Colletotrichum karsti]
MAKQRANRMSPAWWEEKRETICEQYMNKTLQDVIVYLQKEYGVKVTKRQLVYRLNLWNCRKYSTGDGEEGTASSPSIESDDYDSSEDGVGHDEDICSKSHEIPDSIGGHQSQTPVMVEAANTQLAVCDGKGAFNKYVNAKLNMNDFHAMTAIARSAETDEQCRFAMKSLKECIFPQPGSSHWPFYCLLYVLVCDSMNDHLEEGMLSHIRNAVLSILNEGKAFLAKQDGSIDMVGYALLDNLDLNHRQHLLDPIDAKRLQTLLEDFESRNGTSRSHLQEDSPSPLRSLQQCVAWCHKALFDVSRDAYRTNRPDTSARPTPDQMLWKDYIEVFGTLWHILMTDGRSTGIWPQWVCTSVDVFNLPHAELLSCVCWLIVQSAALLHSDEIAADDLVTRFRNAGAAAHQLFHSSQEEVTLWHDFCQTFLRLNRPTAADTPENRAFGAFINGEFEVFVRNTLEIGDDCSLALRLL